MLKHLAGALLFFVAWGATAFTLEVQGITNVPWVMFAGATVANFYHAFLDLCRISEGRRN